MNLSEILAGVPPVAVYGIVFGIVMLESLGIPLPGETAIIASALLSAVDPQIHAWAVGLAAVSGAIIGDSCGYVIGRRWGGPVLGWLSRKFPRHLSEDHIVYAEHLFDRFGAHTVFFGRFIALLRILAGPLAGSLKMHYPRFLAANAAGGVAWAGGVTALVFGLGKVAGTVVADGAWVLLAVLVVAGWLASRRYQGVLDVKVREYAATCRVAQDDDVARAAPEEPGTARAGGTTCRS